MSLLYSSLMTKSTPDKLQDTLASILQHLGVEFRKFKVEEDETVFQGQKHPLYRIDIDTDDASTLIGYHGETIYALQHLLKTIIWTQTGENVFVIVDVDSYRRRQEESVKKMALRKVEAVRKTQQEEILPPMSPYFRRIVHIYMTGKEFADIITESIGEGDQRQVVIKMNTRTE